MRASNASRTTNGIVRRTDHVTRRAAVAALAGVVTATAQIASAVPNRLDQYTAGGTGDWSDASAWTYGVPTSAEQARIISSGTVNVTGPAAADTLAIGFGDNTTSTLNLTAGGSLTSTLNLTVGGSGAVAGSANVLTTLNQTGGSLRVLGNNTLWIADGGSAVYNLSGGNAQISGPTTLVTSGVGFLVGFGVSGTPTPATGTFNLSGGTLAVDTAMQLGRAGGKGIASMTGGALNVGTDLQIGVTGSGTFTQSAGVVSAGYNGFGQSNFGNVFLGLGNSASTRANYAISGTATLNTQGYLDVGGGFGGTVTTAVGGYGDFVMNGGTVNIGDGAREKLGGYFNIGWARSTGAADGTATINAGTLTMSVPNAVIAVGSYDGNTSATLPTQSGVLTINGGTVSDNNGYVDIGRNGATGTLNLAGGELSADYLQWRNPAGNTKTRTFNWTGGILNLNSAITDYPIANAGGTFRPGGAAVKTFTTTGNDGSYTQSAGSVAIDLAANGSYDAIDLTGSAVGAAQLTGGSVNVTAVNGFAPAFGLTTPVITAKSITDAATWNLPTLPAGLAWDRRLSADGSNQVESLSVVRATASTLTSGANWSTAPWSGGVPNATDASAKLAGPGGSIAVDAPVTLGYLQLEGSGGWTIGGTAPLTFSTAGSSVGGILAFGSTSHTISAPVAFNSNSAIATQLSSTAVTLAGNVSGSATVDKTGPGSLTLTSTTSTFTGVWSVSGGTLNIASDANLGAPAASLALNNGTLATSGSITSARNITLGGTNSTINPGGDSTLSGAITGTGGLTKAGTNTLTLSGTAIYSGPTAVNAGMLRVGSGGAPSSASTFTVASGATLDLNGQPAALGSLAGAGNVTTGGANFSVGANNASSTFTGHLSGGGTLTKTGTGTFTISPPGGSGQTAFDGNLVVGAGTLAVTGINFGTFDLPATDITVNTGANLSLGAGSTSPGGLALSSIHGGGSLTYTGGGVLQLLSPSDYTGGTSINSPNGGTLAMADMSTLGADGTPFRLVANGAADRGTGGGLTFGSGGAFNHPITVDAYKVLVLNGSGNGVTLNYPITGGGMMQFSGAGSGFQLNAVNTWLGTYNIDANVTVTAGVDNALPGNAGVAVNGTLDLNGHNDAVGFLLGSGTVNLNGGNLTIGNETDGNAYTGIITGNGNVTKVGGGLQAFNLGTGKSNSFSGNVTISAGTLQITGNINALPPTASVTNDYELVFATTAAASGVTSPAVPTAPNTINGTGEVQVSLAAAESLALTGNNSYTGGTRLVGGTLLVNGDANLGAPTGKVIFAASATPVLKFNSAFNTARNISLESGTGTIDANNFNVSLTGAITGAGGLTAKAGTGSITVNNVRIGGTLTASTGKLAVAPNGTAAGLSTATGLTITSGATLDLADNDMIVDYTGTSPAPGILTSFSAAYHNGAWDAAGLTSSAAAAPAAGGLTTLAIGENAAYGFSSFDGVPVDSTAVLIKYTWYGDLNMNGKIDADDYALIDRSYAKGGLAGTATWVNGDVDYSGTVDAADYLLMDRAFAHQAGTLSPAFLAEREAQFGDTYVSQLVASVPEPTTCSLVVIAAVGLAARRRRHR